MAVVPYRAWNVLQYINSKDSFNFNLKPVCCTAVSAVMRYHGLWQRECQAETQFCLFVLWSGPSDPSETCAPPLLKNSNIYKNTYFLSPLCEALPTFGRIKGLRGGSVGCLLSQLVLGCTLHPPVLWCGSSQHWQNWCSLLVFLLCDFPFLWVTADPCGNTGYGRLDLSPHRQHRRFVWLLQLFLLSSGTIICLWNYEKNNLFEV